MQSHWKLLFGLILAGLFISLPGCTPNSSPIPLTPTSQPSLIPNTPPASLTPSEGPDEPAETATPQVCKPGLLESAINKLQHAESFQMFAHEINAYQIDCPQEESRTVYGEFISTYHIQTSPLMKIHTSHEYRYHPRASFIQDQFFTYEKEGRYLRLRVENEGQYTLEELPFEKIKPFGGDIFQTLLLHYREAHCLRMDETTAVFVLDHPAWYTLERGIGFADLGVLVRQEGEDELIKQYVAAHYPDVHTIRFKIFVSRETGYITDVLLDDRPFMQSVWESVNKALTEKGRKRESLPTYRVLKAHQMKYTFSNYGEVEEITIPQIAND